MTCAYCGWPGVNNYVNITSDRAFNYHSLNTPPGLPTNLCSVCEDMWLAVFIRPGLRKAEYDARQQLDIWKAQKREMGFSL